MTETAPRGPAGPAISFVVPAYNESAFLASTIGAIRRSADPLGRVYEIVVADDASTDGTGALAESLGARVVRCANRQIAGTRNAGALAAHGDILIFVDADTTVNEAVIRAALEAIERGAVGGGCRVDWEEPVQLPWRIFVWTLMTLFGTVHWAAGSFLFCTRAAFVAAGGFDERLYAAEEIWMSRALKRHGRFVVLRQRVVTSARKLRDHSSFHVLRVLGSIVLRGPRSVRKRKGLELWYDQRG
ncbi:MAG: glycosyltransferase [Gemmatimonadota bacterium]|nr:glycosyltransferase [Gemmatimonadota bacterium]